MSPEHKKAIANAKKERAAEIELAERQEVRSVWEKIPESHRRIFEYIEREIDAIRSGERDTEDGDISFFRETRATHFRQFRRYLIQNKEQ